MGITLEYEGLFLQKHEQDTILFQFSGLAWSEQGNCKDNFNDSFLVAMPYSTTSNFWKIKWWKPKGPLVCWENHHARYRIIVFFQVIIRITSSYFSTSNQRKGRKEIIFMLTSFLFLSIPLTKIQEFNMNSTNKSHNCWQKELQWMVPHMHTPREKLLKICSEWY